MVYARDLGCSHEQLLRALTLSNLISIHQKRFIGNLSAYCGAVSAGTAAACGIAYLQGADYDVIGTTIVNAVGTTGGIICDGAKSSCASKISASVEAGVLGYNVLSDFHPIGGRDVLDSEDFLVSSILLPLGSLIYLLFCVTRWGWGFKNYQAEANAGKGMKVAGWMRWLFMIVLPLMILAIFIIGLTG